MCRSLRLWGRAASRTHLLRKVPNPCFVRWFCSGRVLLLAWLAPADIFRCSLADETLGSPCTFSTAITFFHSLNNRFPLPPAQGVLRCNRTANGGKRRYRR